MAEFWREPRNELIRQLRAQGLSIRRIRMHPDVVAANGGPPSIGAVHRAIHGAEPDDDVDIDGDGPPVEVGGPLAVYDEDAAEAAEVAELVSGLYLADGRPNRLALFRLRCAYDDVLTASQERLVVAAEELDERLLSPAERERRRWQFRGPRMRHENHGTFTALREERAWHVNVGKWTWTWTSGDAPGGVEEYRACAQWDSAEDAMAAAQEWVQRRWHGEERAPAP